MATPNDRDKAIAKSLLDQPGNEVWLEDIEDAIAAYREEIEAPLRAEIDRLSRGTVALLWMAEHVMGADAAEALRGWLDHFRAEGRLVVRDAAGLEIAHYPEEGDR